MKTRFAVVMLLVLALAVPASMLAQQNNKAEKDVLAVVDEINQANRTGGADAAAVFEKYLANGVVRVPVSGHFLPRQI